MEKEVILETDKGQIKIYSNDELEFNLTDEKFYYVSLKNRPLTFRCTNHELNKLSELKQQKEERYTMSNDQNAQIDCRITDCKFYKGSGTCSNISPALTLNENKSFVCWSKEEKTEQPKDPNELIGRKVKGFRFEDAESGIAFPTEMEELIGVKGEILRLTLDEHGYVVSFKKPYHCEFTYPADQIEAHLLPEKKTKKERIEELEKRVEQLENLLKPEYKLPNSMDWIVKNHELNKCSPCTLPKLEDKKQAPEFWYVDIQEEKDSELLDVFKEWFVKKVGFGIHFDYYKYGYSGAGHYDGYDWVTYSRDWEGNSDKMQKITLNEWNMWFNK